MAEAGRPGHGLGGRRWATAWRLLRSGDLAGLARRTVAFLGRLGQRPTPGDYGQWRRDWVEVSDIVRARIDKLVAVLPRRPSFTVLVPVDGADVELVAATVSSVAAQRYPNWVLCLTGEGSPGAEVADAVAAAGDSRVRFTGRSPATSGEWVTRLTPGDLLHEAAWDARRPVGGAGELVLDPLIPLVPVHSAPGFALRGAQLAFVARVQLVQQGVHVDAQRGSEAQAHVDQVSQGVDYLDHVLVVDPALEAIDLRLQHEPPLLQQRRLLPEDIHHGDLRPGCVEDGAQPFHILEVRWRRGTGHGDVA